MRKRTATVLVALVLGCAGCEGANSPSQEDEPPSAGEETTLSPGELDDEETAGELPEKEPALRDDTVAR